MIIFPTNVNVGPLCLTFKPSLNNVVGNAPDYLHLFTLLSFPYDHGESDSTKQHLFSREKASLFFDTPLISKDFSNYVKKII